MNLIFKQILAYVKGGVLKLVGSIYGNSNKFIGCCSHPNKNIYFAPWNGENQILEYNTITKLSRYVGSVYTGAKKWGFCITHSSGKVYFGMVEAQKILEYDPITETTSLVGSTSYVGGDKWAGIVEHPITEKLYLTPSLATQVLEFDPATGNSRLVGGILTPANVYKYTAKGVVDGNYIYFAPLGHNQILRYNVITEVTDFVGSVYGNIENIFKWYGFTKYKNKLYSAPFANGQILVYDLIAGTSSLIGPTLTGTNKFSSIEAIYDKLYLIPYGLAQVYEYDLTTNSGRFIGPTYNLISERWIGSVMVDEKIYCAPFGYNQILEISKLN